MNFNNFFMVLSDSQLELLASTLDVKETNAKALATYFQDTLPGHMNIFMRFVMQRPLKRNMALGTQPCTWNMLLNRRCANLTAQFHLSNSLALRVLHLSNGLNVSLRLYRLRRCCCRNIWRALFGTGMMRNTGWLSGSDNIVRLLNYTAMQRTIK